MIPEKRALYCNVDFDTNMASARSHRQQQSCLEAQFYYLLCGNTADRILLDAEPRGEYLQYLSRHGISVPERSMNRENLSGYRAFPWGWSKSAVDRLVKCGAEVDYPPLEIIRKVNGRRFCQWITEQSDLGIEGSCICESAGEAYEYIRKSRSLPLVIKPEHGNSGIGFIHVSSPDTNSMDNPVDELFSEPGNAVIIQPWVERESDFSSLFELRREGGIVSLSHHRTLNNRAGVYFGNLLLPDDPLVAEWNNRLDAGAGTIARQLHDAGYFGPVGLDWIVYPGDRTGRRKCALIDINARQPMSFVAHCLRKQLAGDRYCLFQFAPRGNYPDLADYASWYRGCSKNVFDTERKTGIFLFTPLSYSAGPVEYRPLRHGFLIAGNSEEELLDYDTFLRRSFRGSKGY